MPTCRVQSSVNNHTYLNEERTNFLLVSSFYLMMIYFKGVLSSLYHGGPNDVPNRTEGRDANNQHSRIDIEKAV